MHVPSTIDCHGLSPATTILRIKQALVSLPDEGLPLTVLVDSNCDCDDLEVSLGALAEDVELAAGSDEFLGRG